MGLCSWAGALCLLPVLVFLTVLPYVKADQDQARGRHYYIAAVQIDWNYSGNGPNRSGPTYKKVVFREYEKGFKQAKTHPSWLGLLGPTLRGQEGETIVVTFRNMADRPYSIHPHGIAYGKQSEGAQYFDNTSLKEKEDDLVRPNCEHTYYWEVTSDVSPQRDDPTCLTYTYISHQNVVQDYNSGLIGTLLICKPGSLDDSGKQVHFHQESVFLFGVFDEKQSWHNPTGYATDNHVKYTINGYTSGSLPDVNMCTHTSVSLHLMGMSSEPEVFSVHMNGQVLQQFGHKVSSVGLVSGSATTANMTAVHPGRWLLSSHTTKHIEAGMQGFVDVRRCEGFDSPKRSLTWKQRLESKEWTYYIAAEEIVWDYAPNMPAYIDSDYESQYLKQSSNRIGGKYKKAVYTQYTDDTFTVRAENVQRKNEVGILGPVIRAQIRDIIKVVFKNMASRPYSIYPHGLTIEKSEEGVNYPQGGNRSHSVQPGKTHTYEWRVIEEDEPFDGDSRCLTRMYHSAVNTPRDIASGLIGPLLICKSQSLNVRNVQLKADKEQHAMFAVFDENKSWYLDDNIRTYCDSSRVSKADADFYKSNVMHTINGYVFESGQLLGFCNGEIATWHVSSIGAQDYIQTATFYGHTFELNYRTEDFLSLYPMTGETISMNMDNIGVWLLASLNSHETAKGMRLKFNDVECFRDYEYEYDPNEEKEKDFAVWKPQSMAEYEEEKKKPAVTQESPAEVDLSTYAYIDELGLRSWKNRSKDSSTEALDLSFLDYDAVDLPEGDMNMTSNFSSTMNTTQAEESEEIITRGDVFSYPVPLFSPTSNTTEALVLLDTTINLESVLDNEPGIQEDLSSNQHGKLEGNVSLTTLSSKNITVNVSRLNASEEMSSESMENVTALLGPFNHTSSLESFSNKAIVSGNLSFSSDPISDSSSEELSTPDSREEVVIYLKDNSTEVIKTTSLNSQGQNWTYEVTHQMVPVETPDHTYLTKYIGKVTPHTTLTPTKKPRSRKVNRRQRPQKGHGMKTKKKKEYKPYAKSGLPFSPRGFNPDMSPRGARPMYNAPQPFSNEEDVVNMPVVIGVPRTGFSDYELYVPGNDPDDLRLDKQADVRDEEYEYVTYKDPYSSHDDMKNFTMDEATKYYLKMAGQNVKTYFISAEEVEWNYAGYGQRQEKSLQSTRETKFIKVVFRGYLDGTFSTPDIHGELDEHLGILGPVIKAEVDQTIMVVFRNKASRPYSLHPNGVSYTKQAEGLAYEDESKYWYKYDNEVRPNTTFTYLWKVNARVGPMEGDSYCRTWAYYSGVNPERDIHSGLIGPLLVCRKGTLDRKLVDMREFMLLFMIFDESQSWYYEKNRETMERKNRRTVIDPNFRENLKFHAINGIVYSLKGLRMYTNQLVRWHLFNMGSPRDFQSVYFHGQTFLHKQTNSYRQAVYPLLPGGFATLEMWPSKPGLWQLETEVGFNQQKGMQTLFLVLDNDCYHPLGLGSGSVKDSQITASNTRGYWEPHFARLDNQGKYNAWSTEEVNSWIQVDFLRPVVISQVATQGAKQMLQSQFLVNYAISYSTDRRRWIFYKGDGSGLRKTFIGNDEPYTKKINTFFPPLIGRFIRLHPISWHKKATVRMEFYGCQLDGCSVPLGMESRLIEDHRITASSTASSWYSGPWKPSLARLNTQSTVNAWQAKYTDMNQWLQVELPQVKKITGIITQGAKSFGKEMYVISFALQYSDDGIRWNPYSDDEDYMSKTFIGNTDNNGHVQNYIYPPIFSRFIRIIPTSWKSYITMRIELLGCDFE
ncbi:coagulation factor V [Diretmus argenteus]